MCNFVKKLHIFFFLCTFCINSFAGTISGNDESVFISKVEFDSLKNNLQNQLDKLNSNADNKIDYAISTYLAGIKVDVDPTNLFDNYVSTNGYKPKFYNAIPGYGKMEQTMGMFVGATRQQAYRVYSNLIYNLNHYVAGHHGFQDDAVLSFGNPPWSSSYSSWTMVWYRKQYDKSSSGSMRTGGALSAFSNFNSGTSKTDALKSVASYASKSQSGDGSGWVYQIIGGAPVLKYYDSELYPKMNVNTIIHRYKNYAVLTASYYISNNGKADDFDAEVSIERKTTLGYWEDGTRPAPTQETNAIYTKNVAENTVYATTSQVVTDKTNWYDLYYTGAGGKIQTNSMSGVTVNCYPLKYNVEQKTINSFCNYYVSSIANEKVYHGEGIPILRSERVDTNCEIKIKFSSSEGKILYKVSDKKLINGEFDISASLKESGEVDSNEEITIDAKNLNLNQLVWVNCYSSVDGAIVSIESVECETKQE